MSDKKLDQIRNRIDEIDRQLHQLLNDRARQAQAVAEIKKAADPEAVFYRPSREARVLRGVIERNRGPLADETVARLFREIMSACLALESPVRVAYLGPEGTFTQGAVAKHFGGSVESVPLGAIDEVFREVEASGTHYGVVPVENSLEGMVTHTLDMFTRSSLRICGEVVLPVHQCLMAAGAELGAVRRVYSHGQSLAQCREWLDAHLPHAQRIAVSSNAEAARQASGEADTAAIAGSAAAEVYGLELLASNIEDDPSNTTRFLVIGREAVPASGSDKTSLLVANPNRPGALHSLLEPFARHGVNLTRIESRPSRRTAWDYNFFLDVEGHEEEAPLHDVLEEVRSRAGFFRVLGSYPCPVY
ncbi:MAG TPA: prephenate dehydratase [Gammaproteobacteria bacterium]|nr:prephenate dehydratase [Gammaproteobacteria bacterium]